MWRSRGSLRRARRRRRTRSSGSTRPDTMAEVGPIAKAHVDAGANRVHLPASPLMHGTGAFTTFQSLFLGASIVTLVGRHFDPHELWETVQRERVTQMAIVGDAFAKPMLRALEEAEAKGTPYDISSLQLIISSGVMWSAEVKHGADAARQLHLLRLARLERGRGLRGLDQRARRRAEDGEVHDRRRARRCSTTRASRSCPARARSGGSRSAATSRSATTRTRRSRTRRSSSSTASAGRCPATSRASRPTARSRCSGAARSSSTRAARRSSPKRSKKR